LGAVVHRRCGQDVEHVHARVRRAGSPDAVRRPAGRQPDRRLSRRRVLVLLAGGGHDLLGGRAVREIARGRDDAGRSAGDRGNVYYFWIAHDRLPYLAVSRDGGKHWSKPVMVGPPNLEEAALPTMDIGAEGNVAMTYMGSTNSPGPPFPEADDCKPDPVACFR